MPRYKVTFSFQSYIYTPTESYISAGLEPGPFLTAVQRLIEARQRILPKSVAWLGVRIAQHNVKRRSKILRPGVRFPFANIDAGLSIPPNGLYDDTLGDQNNTNITKVSLLMDRTFDVDRSSKAYLAMVPDPVVRDDEDAYFPANYPDWAGKLESYNEELRESGWSIYARVIGAAAPDVPVVKWVNQEAQPSLLGAKIAAASSAGFADGKEVIVRNVRRRGTDRTSYNGTYDVDNVNATLFPGFVVVFLKDTQTGTADSIKKNGSIQLKTWDYYPILKSEPIWGTSRKRGNSAAGLRGRSASRVSLGR